MGDTSCTLMMILAIVSNNYMILVLPGSSEFQIPMI